MATIKDFRELKCWQEARAIAKDVYCVVRRGDCAKDFGLRDQIQRAAVSIGSNIAEGFERDSNLEFIKFLSYAKGSLGEVMSQLYTAFDVGYISADTFENMIARLKSIGGMIASLQSSIRASGIKGRYHKLETSNQ